MEKKAEARTSMVTCLERSANDVLKVQLKPPHVLLH